MEKSMKIAAVSLAAAALCLCVILAVFGMVPGAWADEAVEAADIEDVAASDESATSDEAATDAIDYDQLELDSILADMNADYEDTLAALTAELESVNTRIGDTYEGYVIKERALINWYTLVETESEQLFARLELGCEEYLEQVTSAYDPETEADAMDEAIDELYESIYEDLFDDFYDDVYYSLLQSVNDQYFGGILSDCPDDVEYDEWYAVRYDSLDDLEDAELALSRIMEEGQTAVYRTIARVELAFDYEVYDVESVLSLDILSDELKAILDEVEADVDATCASISEGLTSVSATIGEGLTPVSAALGETYDDYVATAEALSSWYELVLSESESLVERINDYAIEYFTQLAAEYQADPENRYLYEAAMDEYAYAVYEDAFDTFYESVYEDALGSVDDDYLYGAIDYDDIDAEGVIVDVWEETWEETWYDCHDDLEDAELALSRIMEEGQTAVYRTIARVELAFDYEVYDVESVLSLEVLPNDLVVILDEIEADVDATVATIAGGLDAVSAALGDSYDDYVATAQALTEWYALAQTETEALYDRIDAYMIEYCQAVASEVDHDDTYTLVAAMREIYWLTYTDCTNTFSRAILDDAFEAAYDDYLAGTLDPSDVSDLSGFETWEEEWEAYYEEFSAAYEEVYDQLSVEESYLYGLDTEITIEFIYNDNFDVDSIVEAYDTEFAEELAAEEAEEAAEALEEELGDELEEEEGLEGELGEEAA